MAGPSTALSPVIAASTHWLARAYPPTGADPTAHTLAELQARQAVTVAAWLRYPTPMDAELVAIAGRAVRPSWTGGPAASRTTSWPRTRAGVWGGRRELADSPGVPADLRRAFAIVQTAEVLCLGHDVAR